DRAAWLALCDPELENIPPQDWPESDPIRGGEPVFDFLAVEAQDAWEEDSSPFEYVELIDAGNDRVVADMRREVRGKASGASVAWRYWQVVTFRNEGAAYRMVRRTSRSPRSCWPLGVGDVAGERGDREEVQPSR